MAELKNHVMMLESDGGVFDPAGFGFTGPDGARRTVTAIASMLASLGANKIEAGVGARTSAPA